jgi:hypothetical protein
MSAASPSGSRGRSQRRVALAASVALHTGVGLLLLALVGRQRPADAPPPPVAPIEITLLAPEPRTTPETVVVPPPPRAAPERRSTARASPPGPAQEPERPTPPDAPAPSPVERTSPDADHELDLSFDGLGQAAKQRAADLPGPQDTLGGLLVPAPTPNGRRRTPPETLAAAERRAEALDNVRVGRAYPVHFELLRHARSLIVPEADRVGDELDLGASETVQSWARGYVDRVRELKRQEKSEASPSGDPLGDRHPDVLAALNEAQTQAKAGAVRRVARVCLGVAPDHPVVVTLERSSGNERLDAIALASFQSAARDRPVGPDVRPGLACYLVSVSAFRMPPLPSLSFGWKNGRPDVLYPLKRIKHVSVELESLDYGPRPGPKSLLRRPH